MRNLQDTRVLTLVSTHQFSLQLLEALVEVDLVGGTVTRNAVVLHKIAHKHFELSLQFMFFVVEFRNEVVRLL